MNQQIPIGWEQREQVLHKDISFQSFRQALSFVNAVALLAEEQNHHPDITIRYCNVALDLTTHDSGCLTQKDYTLATAINEIPF